MMSHQASSWRTMTDLRSDNLRVTVPFACARPVTDLIQSTACKLLHSVPSGFQMTAINVTAHASFWITLIVIQIADSSTWTWHLRSVEHFRYVRAVAALFHGDCKRTWHHVNPISAALDVVVAWPVVVMACMHLAYLWPVSSSCRVLLIFTPNSPPGP